MGADDDIAKPSSQRPTYRAHPRHPASPAGPPRCRAAPGHADAASLPEAIQHSRLTMDRARHTAVMWDHGAVSLTVTEFLIP